MTSTVDEENALAWVDHLVLENDVLTRQRDTARAMARGYATHLSEALAELARLRPVVAAAAALAGQPTRIGEFWGRFHELRAAVDAARIGPEEPVP